MYYLFSIQMNRDTDKLYQLRITTYTEVWLYSSFKC